MSKNNILLLSSNGLNTRSGRNLFKKSLIKIGHSDLSGKTIGLVSHPYYEIDEILIAACKELGFKDKNVCVLGGKEKLHSFDILYVGEGNTFLVQEYMRSTGLFEYVKEAVKDGAIYLGASCGAALCGSSIELIRDFDTPVSAKTNFEGLNILSNTAIIPHYTYQQLKKYMESTELVRLAPYDEIINISNNEVLSICNTNERKRIRLE